MLVEGGLNVGKSFNPHFVFLSKTKLYSMIFLRVFLLFHVFSVLIYGYPRLKCMLILNFVTCLQQSPLLAQNLKKFAMHHFENDNRTISM